MSRHGDGKKMTKELTKSQAVAADVIALLRARNPLLWIVTREEGRVERYLFEAAIAARYVPRTWDIAQGVAELDGKPNKDIAGGEADPVVTLNVIRARAENESNKERGVWIMRDLPIWLAGPPGASVLRSLRNLARFLPTVQVADRFQAVMVVSPSGNVPDELAGHATVIEWPLPDREEVAEILDAAIESGGKKIEVPTPEVRDAAIDAAVGLNGEEAAACYARSLVQLKRIDPKIVSQEKKRIIARERVLEWYDPIPGGLDAVGGLDNLKTWLQARRLAYTAEAREYGLPAPKGALLVGIPGCGKSLTAKAIATAWGVPLLRVDLGALKSKYVGESEGNLRKAFKVIEAIGRSVVWFDEIEKALSGATQGAADGGVSGDALGSILSWMQERQGEAFVIATANDVSSLPPELLRKGRFDEVWWVDLPTRTERCEIVKAALRNAGRGEVKIDVGSIADVTQDFTGAEIAALVPEALFAAFADDKRELDTDDLLLAATNVVPLAKTAADKIKRLREWAVGKARPATSAEKAPVERPRRVRALDL